MPAGMYCFRGTPNRTAKAVVPTKAASVWTRRLEGGRADEGGQRLDQETRRLGIRPHAVERDQAAGHGAVQHEAHAHADGDAEKAQQGVREPRKAGEVVRIGQVPDTIHERNSWNKRHDGADDDVRETVPEAYAVTAYA